MLEPVLSRSRFSIPTPNEKGPICLPLVLSNRINAVYLLHLTTNHFTSRTWVVTPYDEFVANSYIMQHIAGYRWVKQDS